MPEASLDNTFGPEVDVYRLDNKIFAMVKTSDPGYVTLKAPPEEVLALLDQYGCARPGYYMNKRHWITFDLTGDEPVAELPDLIADSYRLVRSSLSKKRQAEIDSL
ncbi:MAG: MmcQ/YjbR family DNA-binding protein [Microthrixaceae bacterium]